MEYTIVLTDFSIQHFDIVTISYTVEKENRYRTKIIPDVISTAQPNEFTIKVRTEIMIWKQGKVCELVTLSEFSVEFDEEYDLPKNLRTDISLYIFAQLFLFTSGQMHGVLRVKTKDTVIEGTVIKIRFMRELGPMTKSNVLSALNKHE